MFRITEAQRQEVARCLRYIDEARTALERQENPENRQIIRGLRASADQVFDVLNNLEETDFSTESPHSTRRDSRGARQADQ